MKFNGEVIQNLRHSMANVTWQNINGQSYSVQPVYCISWFRNLLTVLLLLLLSRFSRVRLWRPHRRQPTRLPRPWDSPGKNTGVGCHFLLQSRKVKSESEVAQSCPTLSDPMDRSPPGSPVHGIFQARVAEWATIAYCTLKQKLAIPFDLFLICRLLKMILFFNLLNPH